MNQNQQVEVVVRRMMTDGFESLFRSAIPTARLSLISESIGASPILENVAIYPFDDMMHGQCFNNCIHLVTVMGGEVLYGWAWHQFHDFLVVAEFHAVWRAPDGQLIDVTPPPPGRLTTTFSSDPVRVPPDVAPGEIVKGSEPSRRFALKDLADVAEWISAEDENAAMNRRRFNGGEKAPLAEALPVLERNANARARLVSLFRQESKH